MSEILALKKVIGIQVSQIIPEPKTKPSSQEKHSIPKVDFQNQ